jgi:ubiquinone/menaquinone biosynthesis C-methylase UbiE
LDSPDRPGAESLLHALDKLSDERFREHRSGVFRRVHYLDALKPFPYPDNSFSGVFCSHVLEHIEFSAVPQLFREVLRVLRPSGILRVAVPSLELAIGQHRADSPDERLDQIFENRHLPDVEKVDNRPENSIYVEGQKPPGLS